jgi:hypothetical protein
LRRKAKVLNDGCLDDVIVDVDEERCWLRVARGDLRVVANLAEHPQRVPLDAEPIDAVLTWDAATTTLHEDTVELGAHSVAVVRVPAPPAPAQ